MPRRASAVAAVLLLAAAGTAGAQTAAVAAKSDAELLALGRKLSEWLYYNQADSIVAHMSKEGAEKAGGKAGVEEMSAMVAGRAGSETTLIEDKMTRREGKPQYWREAKFELFTGEPLVLRWVFSPAGDVVGVGIGPKSETPAADK